MTTPSTPRTRRSVITAAAAAGGALVTQALVRPAPAAAANAVLGVINNTTAVTTFRNTQVSNTAKGFMGLVTQSGPGGSTAGVQGQSNSLHGNGVFGVAMAGNSKGVWGRSNDGRGVHGEAVGTTGLNYGVFGESKSNGGRGVQGMGHIGVWGEGAAWGVAGTGQGIGVYGSGDAYGVYAIGDQYGAFGSSTTYGVFGIADGYGVYGAGGQYGVYGDGGNYAVRAVGGTFGVYSTGNSYGVYGSGLYGIWGSSATGQAGHFVGTVQVAGTLQATTKQFLIDHPQDPANRTLAHSCVEAPEMLNVYRGSVTLNSRGAATVRLPRYYEVLNRDHHVQLTAVGAAAPGLHVAREVASGRFGIAGGAPGQKVYWIVTGARADAWARRHPLRVERSKKRADRGKYLNPELFGEPKSASIHALPKAPRHRRPRRLSAPAA
jgi:hypothetical protein